MPLPESREKSDECVFMESVIDTLPELRDVADDHVLYFGEMMPHILMWDFAKVFLSKVIESPLDASFVRKFLAKMESGYSSGVDNVKGLVVVSFIENLMGEYEVVPIIEAFSSSEFSDLVKRVINYDMRPQAQ